MRTLRSRLLLGAVAVGALGAAAAVPATAASGGRVRVVADCVKARYEPSSIIVTCGDAGVTLTRLHWSFWGKGSARGTGSALIKTCDPSCAEGGVRAYRVRVRLSRPETCGRGDRRFTRLAYTFRGHRPKGFHATERARFDCPAG